MLGRCLDQGQGDLLDLIFLGQELDLIFLSQDLILVFLDQGLISLVPDLNSLVPDLISLDPDQISSGLDPTFLVPDHIFMVPEEVDHDLSFLVLVLDPTFQGTCGGISLDLAPSFIRTRNLNRGRETLNRVLMILNRVTLNMVTKGRTTLNMKDLRVLNRADLMTMNMEVTLIKKGQTILIMEVQVILSNRTCLVLDLGLVLDLALVPDQGLEPDLGLVRDQGLDQDMDLAPGQDLVPGQDSAPGLALVLATSGQGGNLAPVAKGHPLWNHAALTVPGVLFRVDPHVRCGGLLPLLGEVNCHPLMTTSLLKYSTLVLLSQVMTEKVALPRGRFSITRMSIEAPTMKRGEMGKREMKEGTRGTGRGKNRAGMRISLLMQNKRMICPVVKLTGDWQQRAEPVMTNCFTSINSLSPSCSEQSRSRWVFLVLPVTVLPSLGLGTWTVVLSLHLWKTGQSAR